MSMISASLALDVACRQSCVLIDVRSEDEYSKGHLPGFINAPILDRSERPAVGICYKEHGHDAAVQLGFKLVGPHRDERVRDWVALSGGRQLLVACWRGGLRSQFAAEWIEQAGTPVLRVEGGYKAMRRELLAALDAPPPLLVMSGLTGSGKTDLLSSLVVPKVDLEGLAHHSGSAFGARAGDPQPSQASFENALGLEFLDQSQSPVVVEDESATIGGLRLPNALRTRMLGSPRVEVEVDLAVRAENIYRDYVAGPLEQGTSRWQLQLTLAANVRKLTRRLGGAMTDEVANKLSDAFASRQSGPEVHAPWISALLVNHYDKCYLHGSLAHTGPVAFRGSYEECRQWITSQYV